MIRSIQTRLIICLSLLVFASVGLTTVVLRFSEIDGSIVFLSVFCFVAMLIFSVYTIFDCFRIYLNKISFLLDAVDNKDYTFRFAEDSGSMRERFTHQTLNRIKDILLQKREEIIIQEQYYELILDKSQTGFIVCDAKGFISQQNKSAKSLLGLTVLTHVAQLERVDVGLTSFITTLGSEENRSFTIASESGSRTLSFRGIYFTRKGERLQMITINDISAELEEKELESWIRLTRVLTHEIMNSVAPIRSLSELLLANEQVSDLERRRSMQIIQTTSNNLISFVEHYRRFSRLPMPEKEAVGVEELLMQCRRLMIQEIPASIKFYVDVDPNIPPLNIDKGQVMQVLINLIRNAFEAIPDSAHGRIRLSAKYYKSGKWAIGVANNGTPIDKEMQDQLFVPFFTTKEGGSGIGLSISKQIVRNHQGNLQLAYSTQKETLFTLNFG